MITWFIPYFGILVSLLMVPKAQASFLLETEGLYYSSTKSTASEGKSTSNYFALFTGATFQKNYFIGFRYEYFSDLIDVNNEGAKITGLNWGPRFGAAFGRGRWMQVAFTYYPLIRFSLSESSVAAGTLHGSGYQGEFALIPPISETMYVGVKMSYRAISYSKQVTTSDSSNDVSFSDKQIFPGFVMGWRFD